MIQLSVREIEESVREKYQNSKRLNHILGVARLAKELALKFNLDSEKAYDVCDIMYGVVLSNYINYKNINHLYIHHLTLFQHKLHYL